MLSKTTHRAVRLSGILIGLAIIAASNPTLANSLDNVVASNAAFTNSLDNNAALTNPLSSSDAAELQSTEAAPTNLISLEPQTTSNMVSPTDRKAIVLQKLNERHQCGISNSNQPISRSNFSQRVGVCLRAIEVKLAQEPDSLSNEDLEMLKEITAAFRDEIDILAADLAIVNEKMNTSAFSTTTKLAGEVIFGFSGFGGAPTTIAPSTNATTGVVTTPINTSSNTVFNDRVRLNFDTSFYGKDRLRTRLQARNITAFNRAITGTNTTRLGFDGNDGDNDSLVSLLQYSFPIGDKSKLIIETVGSEFNENMYTFNPLLTSSGSGSISRFGRYNPIYRQSGDGAAATIDYKLSDGITGTIGYAVPGTAAANPGAGNNGFFNGSNALISQLRFQASPNIDLGLVYARSYNAGGSGVSGGTGTNLADNPFGGARTTANHYNFLASAKLSPGFTLSGWAGLTNANRETAGRGNADIFNYAITAAFQDFGAKGNVLGFIVGAPPKVTGGSTTTAAGVTTPLISATNQFGSPFHIEALYKVKVSDSIDVTPGLLLITNSDANVSAPTEYVGTVRTTFKF
jgi:Carbohydrate-selective porin, OprB family